MGTSSEINFDPTSTTIPPLIPFFLPSNSLLPSGLACPVDVAPALKTSTTKNFGGSKELGQLQFKQLESTAFIMETILTTWDVLASKPFLKLSSCLSTLRRTRERYHKPRHHRHVHRHNCACSL